MNGLTNANMTFVLMIASAISKTPYDSLRYNCWDYSTDFVRDLRADNISARIITGIWNNGAHTWVSVDGTWIEPQTATIVNRSDGYKFGYYSPPKFNPYKIRWLNEHT